MQLAGTGMGAKYLLFPRYKRPDLQKCHFLQNATKKIKSSAKSTRKTVVQLKYIQH
jgi:hypothetical protein